MKKSILLTIVSLLTLSSLLAQDHKKFEIQVFIDKTDLDVYTDRLKSCFITELLKIPDVKTVDSGGRYCLFIKTFPVPDKKSEYDYYYRVHFYDQQKPCKDLVILLNGIESGFDKIDGFESLAKRVIANLNVNYLNKLRQ